MARLISTMTDSSDSIETNDISTPEGVDSSKNSTRQFAAIKEESSISDECSAGSSTEGQSFPISKDTIATSDATPHIQEKNDRPADDGTKATAESNSQATESSSQATESNSQVIESNSQVIESSGTKKKAILSRTRKRKKVASTRAFHAQKSPDQSAVADLYRQAADYFLEVAKFFKIAGDEKKEASARVQAQEQLALAARYSHAKNETD